MLRTLWTFVGLACLVGAAAGQEPQRRPGEAVRQLGFGKVDQCRFSPDGSRIVCWDGGGTQLLDASTGAVQLEYATNVERVRDYGAVRGVAWTSDGSRLLTMYQWNHADLRDAVTGRILQTYELVGGQKNGLAISPDDRLAVTGGADALVRIWDLATGEEVHTLAGHGGGVSCVAFSPDGRHVISGSRDDVAILWDLETGTEAQRFEGHTGDIRALAFAPDGRWFITGSDDHSAIIWDTTTGWRLYTLEGHGWNILAVSISPTGALVATGSEDHTAKIWDAATGNEVTHLSGYESGVSSVDFSPDGGSLCTSSWDCRIRFTETASGTLQREFRVHDQSVRSLVFSPDSQRIILGKDGRLLISHDIETGQVARTYSGLIGGESIHGVAVSPDGTTVLSTWSANQVRLWDAATGVVRRVLSGHADPVRSVQVSRDGNQVLTGSMDASLKLWAFGTGQEIRTFSGHTGGVLSVAFSPDGTQAASGSEDGTVRLWDVDTGAETLVLTGHADAVNGVAFSPDGTQILSGSEDRTARLWDVSSGETTRTFTGHGAAITSVAYAPDGSFILTGSWDNTARLWDPETGVSFRWLQRHTLGVYTVAISPDSQWIATGSLWDNTALLWKASDHLPGPCDDACDSFLRDSDGDGVADCDECVFFRTDPLAPMASLSGLVLDGAGGTVSCATVLAEGLNGSANVATADANGVYQFPALDPQDYDLTVFTPGGESTPAPVTIAPAEDAVIDLSAVPATGAAGVAGAVTEAVTGLALGGVRVQAWAGDTLLDETYTCRTGYYELRLDDGGGGKVTIPIDLSFTASGFDDLLVTVDTTPGETQEADAALTRKVAELCSLSGTVVADGPPVAGAEVSVSRGGVSTLLMADVLGQFALANLDAGQYHVSATAQGFGTNSKNVNLVSTGWSTHVQIDLLKDDDSGGGAGGGGCAAADESASFLDALLVSLLLAAALGSWSIRRRAGEKIQKEAE